MPSSGLWRRVALVRRHVWDEREASIIREKRMTYLGKIMLRMFLAT
jgi:hypothetical protein